MAKKTLSEIAEIAKVDDPESLVPKQEDGRLHGDIDARWGLLSRQLVWCYRYCAHGNAHRAAVEAGYGVKGAISRASRLKRNPRCQIAIRDIMKEAIENVDGDIAKIISGSKLDAEYVIRNLVAEAENFEDGNSANRIKALVKLGEYLGIFKEKGEVNVIVPCKVIIGVNPELV